MERYTSYFEVAWQRLDLPKEYGDAEKYLQSLQKKYAIDVIQLSNLTRNNGNKKEPIEGFLAGQGLDNKEIDTFMNKIKK